MDKVKDVYNQMLDAIKETFEFTTSIIDEYETDVDFYRMFINNVILHVDSVSKGDSKSLCDNHFYLTDGIKFKEIWQDNNCNSSTKESLWKYLHTMLYIILTDELEKYLDDNFKEHKKLNEMKETCKNIEKYLDNLKNFKVDIEPPSLEDSSIGSLAKEIMDEMGINENMDTSKTPSLGDLGSLMSKTFSKIQTKMNNGEFDEKKMMQEAQQMMGGLNMFGGGMPNMNGMPMNKMNVNKRKVVRKKKKMNKKK